MIDWVTDHGGSTIISDLLELSKMIGWVADLGRIKCND